MKLITFTHLSPLALLLFGTLTLAPVMAAMPEQPIAQDPGSTPTAQMPDKAQAPEQIGAPDKAQKTCTRLDKNHDGYVSSKEFKSSKLASKAFSSSDANHDSRLDMKECEQAVRGS